MLFYALTFARPRGTCWKMHIANTDAKFCDGRRIKTIKLDEKPIPHPALMGKENIQFRRHKIRTARAESQEAMATRLS